MNEDIDGLISGYLDETLTQGQLTALETWINADPTNAKRFADAVYFDERLAAELSLKGHADSDDRDEVVIEANFKSQRKHFVGLAALAACLVLGLTLWWQSSADKRPAAAFATMVQVVEAEWRDAGQVVKAGDRLSAQVLQLKEGIVHLMFDSGVEVTLEGPAEFELMSVEQTRLQSGLLTATVPPGAEGFRVDTPSAQVIDLGTTFGIEQHEDGLSEVSVFDGEVEIVPENATGKRLLTEGQTVQLGTDGSVSDVEFASARFEKLWPTASGIAGSTGAFRFAPQWPRRLRLVQSDTEIFVLPEGYARELAAPLGIDQSAAERTVSSVPAGRRVRSFLLQFNPVKPDDPVSPGSVRRIDGSITFQHPILGLIVDGETLEASDEQFSPRSGKVRPFKRGLELDMLGLSDVVSLSEDRRTLTLALTVSERFSDHVRVIVEAPLR